MMMLQHMSPHFGGGQQTTTDHPGSSPRSVTPSPPAQSPSPSPPIHQTNLPEQQDYPSDEQPSRIIFRRSSLQPSDEEIPHYKREPHSRPSTPPASYGHHVRGISPAIEGYTQHYRPRSRTPPVTPTHHRIASVIQERNVIHCIKEERPLRRSSIDEDQQVAQYYRDHHALRYQPHGGEDDEEYDRESRFYRRQYNDDVPEEDRHHYSYRRRRLSERRESLHNDPDSDYSDSQAGGAASGDTDHYPKSEEEEGDDDRPLDLSMKIKRRARKDSGSDSDDSAGPDSDGVPRDRQGRAAYKKSLMKRYRKYRAEGSI